MKNIVYKTLIIILFILVGFLYWDRYFKTLINNNNSSIQKISPSVMPGYSISIVKTPYFSEGYNFGINVKNTSITPFIVGVFFRGCKFTDNKGIEYSGSLEIPTNDGNNGIRFSKALLPGENQMADFKNVTVDIAGAESIGSNGLRFKKCQYDNKGNNICITIDGIKFKECKVTTSTSPDQTTYPNQFPTVVNF